MPIFNYKCKNCSLVFDELAKIDEKVYCPKCNSECEKIPSYCTNVHFYGEGWTTPGSNTIAGCKKETDRLKKINEGDITRKYYL